LSVGEYSSRGDESRESRQINSSSSYDSTDLHECTIDVSLLDHAVYPVTRASVTAVTDEDHIPKSHYIDRGVSKSVVDEDQIVLSTDIKYNVSRCVEAYLNDVRKLVCKPSVNNLVKECPRVGVG